MSTERLRVLFSSLRGRLFAATFAASVAAVGVALLIGVLTTRSAIRDSYREEALREATVVALRLAAVHGGFDVDATGGDNPLGLPEPARPAAPGVAPGEPRPDGRGRRDAHGAPPIVLPLSAAMARLPEAAARRLRDRRSVSGQLQSAGETRIYAAVPVAGHDVVVIATRPGDVAGGDSGRYFTGLVLAALLAAAISAGAAFLLSRRLAQPIAAVAHASSELASGRTPDRLDEPEITELAELARSFNEMADQLARAREAERTVLMSASHELRTPLTAISGYAEAIEDGTIDPVVAAPVILSESSRLERLVQDLLVLARLDQGTFDARREVVDLAQAARSARDRLALRAADGGVALQLEQRPDSFATADADRTVQVITNLLDNAVRVTPRGGSVTVVTERGRVTLRDTGPGFDEADLPHVFERFHMRKRRGMGSPDGSGIGLAIVDELARAMGGSVTVSNRPEGGAEFVVELPPPEAPAPGHIE